jgi:hypothetical protein
MINMKKFVLGLFLILLVSGCTGMPDIFKGLIPSGDNVNKTELSPDLVVIQNLNVIPTPPINAGDEFSVSFEIKNQDEVNEIKNVKYTLFDYGLCKPPDSGTEGTINNFAPLQTEFKEWTFTSPSNDEIAYLPNKCPIRFKVNYTFNATSQIDVDIISKSRLTQLQRAGTPPSFTPSLSIGRGPVKIYLSFGASLPARDNSSLPIFISVEDKGSGLFKEITNYTQSEVKSLTLKVPDDFNISSCDKFDPRGTVSEGGVTYKLYRNKDVIPIIKKKSPQLRCSFTTPNSTAINDLEKTYFITASLEYDYDITGETTVSIKPTSAQ